MSSTFPARFTGNSLHGGWESDHFPALRSTYAFLHWRHWGSRKRCPLLRILYAICVQGSRAPVRNSQVNRAGRYDATCLLASHNSPSFRLLDNRGEGIRWISTGPLLTWNCYVCNEVIMQRWTTERDLCTLRIFGNRFLRDIRDIRGIFLLIIFQKRGKFYGVSNIGKRIIWILLFLSIDGKKGGMLNCWNNFATISKKNI